MAGEKREGQSVQYDHGMNPISPLTFNNDMRNAAKAFGGRPFPHLSVGGNGPLRLFDQGPTTPECTFRTGDTQGLRPNFIPLPVVEEIAESLLGFRPVGPDLHTGLLDLFQLRSAAEPDCFPRT